MYIWQTDVTVFEFFSWFSSENYESYLGMFFFAQICFHKSHISLDWVFMSVEKVFLKSLLEWCKKLSKTIKIFV